jgi:hypothetical protein
VLSDGLLPVPASPWNRVHLMKLEYAKNVMRAKGGHDRNENGAARAPSIFRA